MNILTPSRLPLASAGKHTKEDAQIKASRIKAIREVILKYVVRVVVLGFAVRVVAVECAVPVALLRYVVRVIALACIDRVAILWCVHLMIPETPNTVR